jgi:adenosylhomocysteine nucleosidase
MPEGVVMQRTGASPPNGAERASIGLEGGSECLHLPQLRKLSNHAIIKMGCVRSGPSPMSSIYAHRDRLPVRILVVIAVSAESSGAFEAANVPYLLCGVGKVNAAIALTRELSRYRHDSLPLPMVLNFGTAGSRIHPAGGLVECCEFIQRDMDARELGFPLGATPFDTLQPKLVFSPIFGNLPIALCGTGDSFAGGLADFGCGIVDMEAFALAKVCKLFGTAFACVKYVSDGADHASAVDWQSNVHKAAEGFLQLYHLLDAQTS